MNNQRITVKRIWAKFKWVILAVLWLASLALGYFGFAQYARVNALGLSPSGALYRTFQLISMNSGAVEGENNWMLEVARFALPGLTAITALEALAAIFQEQTVWLRLWRKKEHVIVCGLGRKGRFLVDDLLANGYQVVVIEKTVNSVMAEEYRRRGAIILEGDATDPELLENARIKKAKYLICLLGEDSANLQVAFLAARLVGGVSQHKLTCYVHLESRDLMEVVRASEQSLGADSDVILEVFNVYERAARLLTQNDPTLQGEVNRKTRSYLICGLGGFGKSLVQQMAYSLYRQDRSGKLELIVLDQQADRRVEELRAHCPKLDSVFRFQTVNLDLSANHDLRGHLSGLMKRKNLVEVFICTGNPVLNVQTFLVVSNVLAGRDIPIQTRVDMNSGLTDLVKDCQDGQLMDIYQQTCTHDLVMGGAHELIARQLREHYISGLPGSGEQAQAAKPWDAIEESEKEANRAQAGRIVRILRSQGYRVSPLEDWDAADRTFPAEILEQMAEMEHRLWCEWKVDKGWQAGSVYDSGQKTNPDLVPWEELPEDERDKNRNFIRCLPEILADIGLQIDEQVP